MFHAGSRLGQRQRGLPAVVVAIVVSLVVTLPHPHQGTDDGRKIIFVSADHSQDDVIILARFITLAFRT
jgi:hypothetical protein